MIFSHLQPVSVFVVFVVLFRWKLMGLLLNNASAEFESLLHCEMRRYEFYVPADGRNTSSLPWDQQNAVDSNERRIQRVNCGLPSDRMVI